MTDAEVDVLEKILFVAFGAIIAPIGAYWGARFKNAAVMRDLEDVKTQNREIRQATKEIEAKIEDQMWNKQRQWELKCDLLVDFTRTISDFEQSVMSISHKIENRNKTVKQAELFSSALAKWNEDSDKYQRDSFVVSLVVSLKTQRAMSELATLLRDTTTEILSEEKSGVYSSHHKNIVWHLEFVKGRIRSELDLPPLFSTPLPTPQSSGSSAVPAPAQPSQE